MKKLILICGPAGIGKSTFSKRYIESHPDENPIVISADDTRKAICGGYDKFPPQGNMLIVYDEMIRKAKNLAKANENITILMDTTSLTDRRRLYYAKRLQEYFDVMEIKMLRLHDYSTCLKRNATRPKERLVPEAVIKDMIEHYEECGEEVQALFASIEDIYMD